MYSNLRIRWYFVYYVYYVLSYMTVGKVRDQFTITASDRGEQQSVGKYWYWQGNWSFDRDMFENYFIVYVALKSFHKILFSATWFSPLLYKFFLQAVDCPGTVIFRHFSCFHRKHYLNSSCYSTTILVYTSDIYREKFHTSKPYYARTWNGWRIS